MPPTRSLELVWTLPCSEASQSQVDHDASSVTRHAKKKSSPRIPRPPNAFILFRSSFIKSQRVSTDVETNHSTLSKIIGMTWQGLSEAERKVWHDKARAALDEHRRRFPAYAFRPSHQKPASSPGSGGSGPKKRKVREVEPKDTKRCAKIAELLVRGLEGVELDEAIREFDKTHVPEIITRFETPITESAYRKAAGQKVEPKPKKDAQVSETTIVDWDVETPPALEEAYAEQKMYYPEPEPASAFADEGSYPCSPVDASPIYATETFFPPNFFNSDASTFPESAFPQSQSLPPSYGLYPRGSFCDFPPESPTELDFFEFTAPPGDYLADLMNFDMPPPLTPTWDISPPVMGF